MYPSGLQDLDQLVKFLPSGACGDISGVSLFWLSEVIEKK